MLKSDLAAELTEAKSHTLEQDIDRCDVYVDKALSKKIGKPAGNYVTVESRIAAEGNAARFRRLSKAIADVLRELAPDGEDMVVTPKDVDIMVENCAEIIAGAINMFGKKHR